MKTRNLNVILLLIFFICSCQQTSVEDRNKEAVRDLIILSILSAETMKVNEPSKDKNYGFSEENPILIYDGKTTISSISRTKAFLTSLRDKSGNSVKWDRVGSINRGENNILDKYKVITPSKTDYLYFNIYKSSELYIPYGYDFVKTNPYIKKKP